MEQKILAQRILLVSLVCLAYEMVLFRLFTFLFGYHFVSLLVALATLGYGASGVLAPHVPRFLKNALCPFFLLALLGSSALFTFLPLDVYEVFVHPVQWVYLGIVLFVAFLPFFFHGLLQIVAFERYPELFPSFYALNFTGSALGVLGALLFLAVWREIHVLCVLALLSGCFGLEGKWRVATLGVLPLLFLPLSPFLPLHSPSRALHVLPETELLQVYRNPAEYLEVFLTPHQRIGWGLSPRFQGVPPETFSLVFDHRDTFLFPRTIDQSFCEHLLVALPFALFHPERILVIEEREGLTTYAASFLGAHAIDFVTQSPLFAKFLQDYVPSFPARIHVALPRKFIASSKSSWEIVVARVPVGRATVFPGSFAFAEDFLFTVEGMRDLFRVLTPEGVGIFALFLQHPPSVLPKLVLLLREVFGKEALQKQLLVVKSLDFALVLVKKVPWSEHEQSMVFRYVREHSFDVVYGPWGEDEVEQVFQTGKRYYRAVCDALEGKGTPLFDLRPPRDSRPYFRNFFSFGACREVLGAIGKRWLPFGGAGFLAVLAVLGMVVGFSAVFMLFPIFFRQRIALPARRRLLLGGVCTGLGFMFVEIPLFMFLGVLVGFPLYSFSFLLGILLVFSGFGSFLVFRTGFRFPRGLFVSHPLLLCGTLLGIYALRGTLVGLSPLGSLVLSTPFLGILGCLLGFPFPLLSQSVRRLSPTLFSEVFAWNGFFSVAASLLAHLVLVFLGFWYALFGAVSAYIVFSLLLYPLFPCQRDESHST